MTARQAIRQKMLRMLCAMLLVALGFAHKPIDAHAMTPMDLASVTSVDLSDYVLPDGSIADICFAGHVDKAPSGQHIDNTCEACRLSAASAVPLPSLSDEQIIRHEASVIFPLPVVMASTVLRLGASSPRGPPNGSYSA